MKSFEERLRLESAAWVDAGLVSTGQRTALLARYPEGEGGGRFLAVLAGVGGALVLAGVCLLIGSHWEQIGDWVKLGGLVALLTGAYTAGWRCLVAPGRYPRIGDACFMVGAGLFMAGIALVSQIFHLNSRPASGVKLWWLGIAAVPWVTGSKGAQFLSVAALLTWLGMELNTADSWIALTPGPWGGPGPFTFLAVMMLLNLANWLAGLALRETRFEAFAGLQEKWGAGLTCLGIYLLAFVRHDWEWRSSPNDNPATWPPLALAGGLVLAAGWGAWRQSRRDLLTLAPWLGLTLVPVVAIYLGWQIGDAGWLWSILAWGTLFMLNLFMVHVGLATGRTGWVNLGIGFIALNIITRYFDLFGTMLQGGIFFVVSGVIVLVLGIGLERKRRALLRTLRAREEAG